MYRLLIDNGHGVNTPGKRSPDGRLREYLYTREIAKAVAEHFQSAGLPVDLIVPEEIDITLPVRCARVNRIVDEHPDQQCLFISIHNNAAGMGNWMTARGWEVHVSRNASNASRVLANNLVKVAREDLGVQVRVPTQTQNYWESNFYVLSHTKCPAILTENFFQDNKEDVVFLLSKEGRTLVENIHILGISKYLDYPYSLILPKGI